MTFSIHGTQGKPELLVPAGSIESFFAAIDQGADAVYAGLRSFSARGRARNFTLEDISRMAALCRREGRRIYVTLNTLLKEHELPEIIDILAGLADARVDALIVQDLGLSKIVRDHFPSLPLHASTQMTIHNVEGVRQMAALGFRRVVLSRELSLPEIRSVAAASKIELECFIHGALCFCISGQCLFSSFLGGRSGNRGDCAQPCRWMYKLDGASEYPFSTLDLWGIDSIPALAAAGVSSIKIEGRMKPAGYVAAVTAAYRKVLDASPGELAERRREARVLLAQARGRTGTSGFLVEGAPAPLTDSGIQGVVGQPLGTVESVSPTGFTFTSSERFHSGDRLRVMPGNDRKGRTFTVRGIVAAGKEGTVAQAGVRVTVPTPFRVAPGDAVYRTVDGASGEMSESACLRRLAAIQPERISCNVSLLLDGETLTVRGTTDELSFEADFRVGPLDAARGDRATEVLRARFAETGDSPFALAAFDATRFGDRFIPPSRLKEIRRSFYEAFGREFRERAATGRQELRAAAMRMLARISHHPATAAADTGISTASPSGRAPCIHARLHPLVTQRGEKCGLAVEPHPPTSVRPELMLGVSSPDEVAGLDREGIAGFLLPLGRETVRRLPEFIPQLAGYADRIIWRLPFWIPPADMASVVESVQSLVGAGYRRFEASNPAHFRLLRGKGAVIVAGWRLGTMNRAAILSLHGQGAADAILSPEDDIRNVEALLRADLPVRRWVTVYGKVPLMVSRIPVPRGLRQAALSTGGQDAIEVSEEDRLTVLRGTTPFSITERCEQLRADGAGAFLVELAGSSPAEREVAIRATLEGAPFAGGSSFNFDRERRP